MLTRILFRQSVAGSSTVHGSAITLPFGQSHESTAVVQISSDDGGAIVDATLYGRLLSDASAQWATLTTGSSGGIQIVPRCAEYKVSVVNSSISAQQFTVVVAV